MGGDELDIALRLLDDQLIDADGRRCGRVDDIELHGGPGTPTTVAALLTGTGAWPKRVPRRVTPALDAITPPFTHRIPWDAVQDVTTTVKLTRTSAELGLTTDDGRNVRWNGTAAEESLLASALLGTPAVTASKIELGRIRDIRVTRRSSPAETVDEPWIVTGLLIGARGLLHRFGATGQPRDRAAADATTSRALLPWEHVLEVSDERVRVADPP